MIGLQYLVGIGIFFFIGGVNAMLIRAELLRPSPQLFGAGNYLTIVSLHGAMMMGIMTSGVLGPFANYFVPLMIGAKRMAFPRIEALTFWLLMAAGAILTSAALLRRPSHRLDRLRATERPGEHGNSTRTSSSSSSSGSR